MPSQQLGAIAGWLAPFCSMSLACCPSPLHSLETGLVTYYQILLAHLPPKLLKAKGREATCFQKVSKPQEEQLSGPTHCILDMKAATYAILLRMRAWLAFHRAQGQAKVELFKHSEAGAHYISCTSCNAQQASNVQKPRVCL